MSAHSRWPRTSSWLVAAGLLACRPASVNEAAQRLHPAVNNIHDLQTRPTPARPKPAAATTTGAATGVKPGPAITRAPETDPAALLAAGQAEAALRHLASEPVATAGTPEWFVHWALRGRAERLRGQPELAVAALAPLVAATSTPPGLPRELIADEYARSLMAAAASSPDQAAELREQADELRKQAAEVWRKALKLEPVRNLAVMRVAHAEALAAIEGEGAARRTAATKAVKALTEVLRAYPEHPRAAALELARAFALQRAGKARESYAALRRVAVVRTGTTEADSAEATLTAAGHAPRWTAADKLERAMAARSQRHYDVSRALLDEVVDDPNTPAHLRTQALRSRAYTAKKQRDFKQSAADLETLFKASPSSELRHDYLQALDRAARYDDALALYLTRADKKGGTGKAALTGAIDQAIRGGRYAQAKALLERLPAKDRQRGDRPWQDAWLKYRLGEKEAAIAAFTALEKRARAEQLTFIRYFRGRAMLEVPEDRAEGVALLKGIVAAGPLDYYGLQARQRLLDAGEDPGPVPVLSPMSSETGDPPAPAQARATFAALAEQYGAAIPALRRGEFLYAAGWIDEAQRELRIAVDSLELVAPIGKGGWTPKHEDHFRGLAWLATWKQPKLSLPREARKALREPGAVASLREGLRELCWALGEPHRMARLTPASAGSYRARWHPRAYRATVEREAAAREVDPTQLWALMYTESRFRRHAVSSVGARGAIQIMPNTGELLAARLGETLSDTDTLFDIDTNVHLAAYYLDELLIKFHGQAAMAYASYNGGPFNVERWLAAKADRAGGGQPLELDVFIAEIPLRETANYTRRVLEVQAAYSLLYRGELPRWANTVDPQAGSNIDF